jgi:hypothetical protein
LTEEIIVYCKTYKKTYRSANSSENSSKDVAVRQNRAEVMGKCWPDDYAGDENARAALKSRSRQIRARHILPHLDTNV